MNNQQMYQNNMNMAGAAPGYTNGGYGYAYGNPGYPNYGMAYTAPRPQALNSQPLTQDIVNTLRQDGNEFNMKVDQKELWRAVCTHKDPTNGQSTLVYNNEDGTYTCSICGETFNFFEGNTTDIDTAVKVLIDMMQTCKTIYLDAPNTMTEQYYQMIPLLRRFSALWKHAINNFSKYENNGNPLAPINGNYAGFNAINQLLTNPYGFNYNQPFYGNQQPMPGIHGRKAPVAHLGGELLVVEVRGEHSRYSVGFLVQHDLTVHVRPLGRVDTERLRRRDMPYVRPWIVVRVELLPPVPLYPEDGCGDDNRHDSNHHDIFHRPSFDGDNQISHVINSVGCRSGLWRCQSKDRHSYLHRPWWRFRTALS